jgi:hypothetical protein
MKAGERTSMFAVMVICSLLAMSCLLPGMIPLTPIPQTPMPAMEKDTDKVIEVLKGGDWHTLGSLAEERYAEADYAGPGTLTFTVVLTDDLPIYFNYGWCATTEEILKQNFEHITVRLYFNDEKLGSDVVQNLSYTSPSGLVCLDFGVLMSDWSAGEYKLEAVATFNEKINDGLADYEAGDYIFEYNVNVK